MLGIGLGVVDTEMNKTYLVSSLREFRLADTFKALSLVSFFSDLYISTPHGEQNRHGACVEEEVDSNQ